ncbi:MAG: biopolymer transporter ExbD [Planctomycetota bacterium]|nr:MAG: biopolymer transporter ExbD [Planctomycetota bacterium]
MRDRLPHPINATVNLAPMVDVMMCLIIFFLLGSRLVAEQYRRIDLAHAASAREIERDRLGARVVVNIRPAADDPLVAEYVVHAWNGERIAEIVFDEAGVADFLRQRAAQLRETVGEARCVVRADREVPYGRVETVLRACGSAGISNVYLSARTGREQEGG